ncbi:uncharacterized protein LOC120182749 [Hibiscus syriacus]|uniref:uncharacterized protein LOC120182749 n=1 Tax=Hibiscus syriacus TaxID=106335 RepID=UPI001924B526|nr:uncharacterized protein LOC120182749 [Hibiscus syriacus]
MVINNKEIGVISVYEPNVQGDKRDFFEQLNSVIAVLNIPVIVGGDFNVVRSESERVRGGDQMVESRHDMFLVSTDIASMFPLLTQSSLPRGLFDHRPIILKDNSVKKFSGPFKWFKHWEDDHILVEKIKRLCAVNKGLGLSQILEWVKKATKDREREVRQINPDSVEEIRKKLDILENRVISNSRSNSDLSEIISLKPCLWAVLRKEEREWLQKSRLRWFKECNKNTKYFYLSTVSRGRTN